ncbi:MAG TPA: hypothetical protein VM260_16400, partial [Pirellula sp.]|nr:hypothetical protein [Pirellula sp.]
HSMIVADQHLFVSTREGKIFCFGASDGTRLPAVWQHQMVRLNVSDNASTFAKALAREAGSLFGTAIVMGLDGW